MACPTVPYFFYIISLITRFSGGKKLIERKCFLIFCTTLSETFLILRRIQQDIIINVHKFSISVPRYSCQILLKLEFSPHIFEQYSNSSFVRNPSCGGRVVPCEWTHTHRRTNMANLIVSMRNIANEPKNQFKASTVMGKTAWLSPFCP